MRIRRFQASDGAVLANWYDESKHGPKAPDFTSQEMAGAWVAVDENDVPRACLGARRTVELMFVGDPGWETAALRMAALKALVREAFRGLVAAGFRSGHCWVEATMRRAWTRRLQQLGMERDQRESFRIEAE